MSTIKPFKIAIPDEDIQKLNQKISETRFPGGGPNGWERGTPIQDIKRLSKYWQESFSWRSFEERLNQLPNFETTISVDGFDPIQVHFIHQQSSASDAIPLLFVHGWPGGFHEVTKCLPFFAESERNGGPAFHVVAPSLPNFGFSSRVESPGFDARQYAETCHKLMLALGYEKYACQGGDWGSLICRVIGITYPKSLLAVHINMVSANPPPPSSPFSYLRYLVTDFLQWYTPEEQLGIKGLQHYQRHGSGYFHIQQQSPNTIGVALADSPVGLLAWIYDKLVNWTDEYPWTDDEVCAWISLYWFSRAGPAASVTIYHEVLEGTGPKGFGIACPNVKMGFSYFPKEIANTPRFWNRRLGDVVFEREHEKGGHFAAWEQPEALVDDLRVMFGPNGSVRKL
ncbi:epoxide hydrolase 1 [Annulohypoxylon maeteangense]|uniref:epoxide hydrolase 1 n=1 Tax=Annulohypoxylon maeteangense TaxID=1927788 RepID=UPI0020081218|nr:epoxide hydrolase 1 [Annulohypoxylon maeteangense]KAI0889383.1 epoxide hydrolase 1 [Annulohypoxylon maeteangense]